MDMLRYTFNIWIIHDKREHLVSGIKYVINLIDAVYACWNDIKTGRKPRTLVCKADGGISECRYGKDAHKNPCDHFGKARKYSEGGKTETLDRHPADIEYTKSPVEETEGS